MRDQARRFLKIASLLLAFASPADGGSAQLAPIELKPVPSAPIADGFTFAAAGDFIYLRPMLPTIEQQSPAMLAILRAATVSFVNFETSAFDLRNFTGYPQAESGGAWLVGAPAIASDAKQMGFDIVGRANNHGGDWGVEGLLETQKVLDDAGLVNAGSGRTLSAARAPAYLDTPAGRVGLVAATSTFAPLSRAADPATGIAGRPGVNFIRTEKISLVSPADLAVLARLAEGAPGKRVILNGMAYEARPAGAPEGVGAMTTHFEIDRADEQANLLAVRQAKGNGNFVAFSLHTHENGAKATDPADFTISFAHHIIDAGADIFVAHGPHQLRGIEIYKGRPIFYSVGNFAMMNNALDALPAEMYEQYGVLPGSATVAEVLQARNARQFADPVLFEAVIAVSRFVEGRASEVRLYPIDLGTTLTGAARGVPRLADAAVGRRILERLQRLSRPFGTDIAIEKGVGVIRLRAGEGAERPGTTKSRRSS